MKNLKSYKEDSLSSNLAETLVNKGLLSADQLAIVAKEQQTKGESQFETILSLGFISEQTLNQLLSESQGLRTIDLENTSIDHDLIRQFPQHLAEQRQVLPISVENQKLILAMVDIHDLRAMDQARKYFPDLKVDPVIATSAQIKQAIDRYYGYELAIDALLKEIEHKNKTLDVDASWVSPVVRLVEALLVHGIKLGASDIHFQPEESYVRVRYRVDSTLLQLCVSHKSYWSAICVRLKVISQLNLAESRKPQSGRLSMRYGMREVDFRVSSHPTVQGESIVLRILDKQHSIRTLNQLGFTDSQVDSLTKLIKQPQGLFIITGPTGSGKTTTLYSILQYLNSADRNIMTLEQPVEYRLPMIRQSEIRESGTTTFADGVRSLLRQDPDIIFIGEIRDEDTAQMALRAAMTGHLVFTTLHTNDSLGVLTRLQDLGLKPSMVADYLVAAVSQRLLRLICRDCKGQGCSTCHQTGYKGRQAVGELLIFNQPLKDLVASGASVHHLRREATKHGFVSMKRQAQDLVEKGLTAREEIEYNLGSLHDD